MKTPESTMLTQKPPTISLPKNWPSHVKSAVLNVISLAHFLITGQFPVSRLYVQVAVYKVDASCKLFKPSKDAIRKASQSGRSLTLHVRGGMVLAVPCTRLFGEAD